MPATNISADQREDNIAKVARQAAEAALCHYAHLAGLRWNDDEFEAEADAMAWLIARQLRGTEDAV